MSTIQLPNPDDFARKRLLGSKLTYREFAQKVSDLTHGNETLGKRPLNWEEIAKEFRCDPKFIYTLRDLALSLKLLIFEDGIYKKPKLLKRSYLSDNLEEFKKIPEIKTWFEFMEYSKFGGTLKGRSTHMNKFKQICDTLKIHPSTFISSGNPQAVIRECENYLKEFLNLHKEGKSTVKITNETKHILQTDSLQKKDYMEGCRYNYAQAFLSFLKAFTYAVPVGSSQIFAQSIKKFHGKYPDVALTQQQFDECKRWAIEKEGIDSDFFRWLMFGIESCSRHDAILNCKNDYYKLNQDGKEFYCLKVLETKTEHKNGGIWTKYITIPELKESIDTVSKRSSYLIEKRGKNDIKKIHSRLKKLYIHLKIDKKWLRYYDDDTTGYVMKHPTHCLRHFGCQLWLQRLGMAAIGLVAKMGGWNGMDEANSSYGQITEQEFLAEVTRTMK